MFYQPARQQFDQGYSPFSGGLGQFGYSTFGSPFGFGGGGFGGFGGGFGGGYGPFGFGGGYSPFGFGGGYGGFNPMMGGLGQFGYSPFGFGGGFGNFNPFFSGIGGLGQFNSQQNMQSPNAGNVQDTGVSQPLKQSYETRMPTEEDWRLHNAFTPFTPQQPTFQSPISNYKNMPDPRVIGAHNQIEQLVRQRYPTPLREPGSLTMDIKPDEAYRSELMERFGLGVNRGQREAGMRNAMDAATNPLDDSRMGVENARSARENWFRKSPEQQQRLLNQSQQLQTLGVNSPQMQAFLG